MIHAKWADSWRQIYTPYVNITGIWKRVKAAWTKVDGTWKQIYAECPTYFSVPNVSSSPISRGYGSIHTYTPGMHNRTISIPEVYIGYNLVGWSATMSFTMFDIDTASSSQPQVVSGMQFTNSAGTARALNYYWPPMGSVVDNVSGYNCYFTGSYSSYAGWYRWTSSDGDGNFSGYNQNYFTTNISQTFAALPITGQSLNIYAYAVDHGRNWGLACYWQNMKLTLQNPHTGDTVALSFV